MEKIENVQMDISRRLTVVVQKLKKQGLLREVNETTDSREIFETNALEGVGTSFRTTVDIMNSKPSEDALHRVRSGMLLDSITADKRVLEVIGMYAAKDLASRMARDQSGYELTETEVRSFHALISSQELFAGAYRNVNVEISKAIHKPPHPVDVPRLMRELVDWSNDALDRTPPILRAAVTHAWLTHIHPFDDGNGRTARLMVNILMTQSGLPPVIVRHQADRALYLDGLAHSDEAGDILPFSGVLITTLKRHIRQVEKPSFLRRIFLDEIHARGGSLFESWENATGLFVGKLTSALFAYRLRVERVGGIDRTSFELLRNADSDGNVWFLKVLNSEGGELLIWYGYSSWETLRYTPGPGRMPSMYFSVRNYDQRLTPYRRTRRNELGGLHEVVVVPDVPNRVYAVLDTVKHGGVGDSADYIAEIIACAFSRNEIPLPQILAR